MNRFPSFVIPVQPLAIIGRDNGFEMTGINNCQRQRAIAGILVNLNEEKLASVVLSDRKVPNKSLIEIFLTKSILLQNLCNLIQDCLKRDLGLPKNRTMLLLEGSSHYLIELLPLFMSFNRVLRPLTEGVDDLHIRQKKRLAMIRGDDGGYLENSLEYSFAINKSRKDVDGFFLAVQNSMCELMRKLVEV
ncbi:hypothetical protein L1887_23198 [Cichorium endivia]|nr:hypothetical protein L1887_23198 [Cichorium endivia]